MSNVNPISKLSKQDDAIAHIIYARDCIHAGKLPNALASLDFAIHHLDQVNRYLIDAEVLRLLEQ